MPDDPQNPPTPPAQPPGNNGDPPPGSAQNPPQTPPDGNGNGDGDPAPVPYGRFKQVNDELKELRDWKAKQEDAAKKERDKKLQEEGKLKELLEERERELESERLENIKNRVALSAGLDPDLIPYLRGGNEEEIKKSADLLASKMKPASGPGVPPSSRTPQPANVDLAQMNPSQVRKAWKPEDS